MGFKNLPWGGMDIFWNNTFKFCYFKTAYNKTFEQKFVNVSTNPSPCVYNTCIFTFTTIPEIVPTSQLQQVYNFACEHPEIVPTSQKQQVYNFACEPYYVMKSVLKQFQKPFWHFCTSLAATMNLTKVQ